MFFFVDVLDSFGHCLKEIDLYEISFTEKWA